MLYMKEMRAKVVAECTLKESAAINQILGRRVGVGIVVDVVVVRPPARARRFCSGARRGAAVDAAGGRAGGRSGQKLPA